MTSYRKQREERRRLKYRAMGQKSQQVQAACRMAGIDHLVLAEIEIQNLPRRQGDALGCLQWTDFRTGRVRRLIIRIGNRADRITAEAPAGKASASHGWTWLLTHLRKHLVTGCG